MTLEARNFDVAALRRLAHSPIRNYAIPGLTSSLIGGAGHGCIRLFECSRDHQEEITPHSHRFDFQCWVLAGEVRNRIWNQAWSHGDHFLRSKLSYGGECGSYKKTEVGVERYEHVDTIYTAGDCYAMTARQIHSIHFSRGACVLFFEGPMRHDDSVILEPWVDGEVVPTFEVKPWMFKRPSAKEE